MRELFVPLLLVVAVAIGLLAFAGSFQSASTTSTNVMEVSRLQHEAAQARDQARTARKELKEAQDHIQRLEADNKLLKKRIAELEQKAKSQGMGSGI